MDCPVCKNVSLVMSERQGIEIDYCPNCRGVWLDRGELDKIIERTVTGSAAPAPAATHFGSQAARSHGHHSYPHKPKKKEGFLSDLFDFD